MPRAANNSGFPQATAPIQQVHSNLSQEVIQITDDKLRLVLDDHLRKLEDRRSWIGPFGVFLAVLTVFCSSEFKVAFGVPAAVWQAIFIIVGVVSFMWLINTLIRIIRSPTTDTLLDKIKNRTHP